MNDLYRIIMVSNVLFVVVNAIDEDEILGEFKTLNGAEELVEKLESK